MMWAMWAMGTMAATMLAKGMAGTLAGRGGTPGRGRGGGGGGGGSGDGGGGSCLLQGSLLFIVKIFLCGIFMMCGGNWQGHTSPHTLVTLEVCRRTFGWGRKLSSKIVVCKYQKLASKKAWQPKLVCSFLYQSFGDKK
jgi:hypothetical protein